MRSPPRRLAVSFDRALTGAAAARLVEGTGVDEVVEPSRVDVAGARVSDGDVDEIDEVDVDLEDEDDVGDGNVLVVVVGRVVVGARVVWVGVVAEVRGTVTRGATDAGRTRMYNTRVTAKIALSTKVERRIRRCIRLRVPRRSSRDLRTR
jgi:hypothetical protein